MHGWALVLALVPAFPIPGAQVAPDPTRTLTVEQAVGWVALYYVPPGGRTYESQTFGMRQPYDDRRIARLPPTLRIPRVSAAPLYLRLSVDEESRILSPLRDRAASPNAIDQFTSRAERVDAPPLRGVH